MSKSATMGGMRRLLGVLVAVLAIAPVATIDARSAAPPALSGADVVAACERAVGPVPEIGPRACRSAQSVVWGVAARCRALFPGIDGACPIIDGRVIGEEQIAAYERSWVHRAIGLQRALDDGEPFFEQLLPHTHNSFNSSSYPPTLTNQDPNQVYGMRDQLRMDIRAIEMDVHWVPTLHGNSVVLCHGEPIAVPGTPVVVHVGCTIDRPLTAGLAELRRWLDAPANRGEVVLLYLENNLDGKARAHAEAAAAIRHHLGALVARPPVGQPCAPMPMSTSRAALRAAGTRVLIVGNCGPGEWGNWVHERGPRWDEAGSPPGDDFPAYPACRAAGSGVPFGTHLIRRYEDSTWLSAMVGAGGALTLTDARRMVRCGVNLVGFDQLMPSDPRLAAIVWSWAPSHPSVTATGQCARQDGDGRFRAAGCGDAYRFACRDALGGWRATAAAGPWADGSATCAAEFPGTTFAVPANGYRNELLRAAAAGDPVWVAYHQAGAAWVVA